MIARPLHRCEQKRHPAGFRKSVCTHLPAPTCLLYFPGNGTGVTRKKAGAPAAKSIWIGRRSGFLS